jgi:hypothetical protein
MMTVEAERGRPVDSTSTAERLKSTSGEAPVLVSEVLDPADSEWCSMSTKGN